MMHASPFLTKPVTLFLSGGLLLLLLSTCGRFGSKQIRVSNLQYEAVIERGNREKLLRAIVQLRYNEIPTLLQITSLTSSPRIQASGDLGLLDIEDLISGGQVRGGIQYSNGMNIIYSPVSGKDFTNTFLRPIDLGEIIYLSQAGWDVEKIFRMVVRSMNDLDNTHLGPGATTLAPIENANFLRALEIMDTLFQRHYLFMGVTSPKADGISIPSGRFHVDSLGIRDPLYLELCELLNINPDLNSFEVRPGLGHSEREDLLLINSRSTMGMFSFLGYGITIPEKHIEESRVTIPLDRDGNLMNGPEVIDDLWSIRTSKSRPKNAWLSIPYRKHWFYIEEGDQRSQKIFALAHLIFILQQSTNLSQAPFLSLPVTGN